MSYKMNDYKMDLRKTLTPERDIWAVSGYSVCSPFMGTVTGVQACFAPPFSAPNLSFGTMFTVNGHQVPDEGNLGKDDCGVLYSGGEWLPSKIVRTGTYHWNVDGSLLSLAMTSELVPLFGEAGFAVKISVKNRMETLMKVSAKPVFTPGGPSLTPLSGWEFTPPKAIEDARQIDNNIWENSQVRVTLLGGETTVTIGAGESQDIYYAVLMTEAGTEAPGGDIGGRIDKTEKRWQRLVELTADKLPTVKSDIPGLEEYYKRSMLSGLVSLWENETFITNPYPATSGVDGGSICCYPWDVAGYSAEALVMLLGDQSLDFLKAMLKSGIDKHITMAPDGNGLGWCPYSYSMWSLTNLYSVILAYCNEGYELFDEMVQIFEKEEERLPEWEHLKDYGRQHNLLEMRTSGYEYFVVSPNAERAWCYDYLADLGESLGREMKGWHKKAELIRESIRRNLWDENSGWFKCLHPNNHVEMTYSVQIFDAVRFGACDEGMKKAVFSHIRDGAFLGKYGVSSVSAEDKLHYELNDVDWSGGGSYTGDGPELARMLWEDGREELAFDVLKRHFWMGEHLLYYPQQHYCDIPAIPKNKRANIIAGVAGMGAILFGMAGIKTERDGSLTIDAKPPKEGFVEIKDYKFRDKTIDIMMRPNYISIIVNGSAVYEGEPKGVLI